MGVSRSLCWIVLALGMVTAADSAAQIPALHATALTGEAVNLPEALKGKVGVLAIGFSHASGDAVKGWGQRLMVDYRDSTKVIYFEMPVLAGVPKFVRGMITKSMKGSVPEREQARFVPILDNEAGWKAVARYGKPDDAYVLLVDGQGKILWQGEGPATDASYAELKRRVEQAADTR